MHYLKLENGGYKATGEFVQQLYNHMTQGNPKCKYAIGEFYYCNWPLLFTKQGNRKVFLDTKWGHPYEQTWMSYVFQEQRKKNIKAGCLLLSPIAHNRVYFYKAQDRRES